MCQHEKLELSPNLHLQIFLFCILNLTQERRFWDERKTRGKLDFERLVNIWKLRDSLDFEIEDVVVVRGESKKKSNGSSLRFGIITGRASDGMSYLVRVSE